MYWMNREMVEHEKAAKKRWEGRGEKEIQMTNRQGKKNSQK